VEVLPNQTYRVELANGHRVVAFVTRKARLSFGRLSPGEKVMLEMSPYDLSAGRIIAEVQTN
jgi:translation initiation factor IF-1